MPCRDGRDDFSGGSVRTEYVDNPETRKRLNKVTAHLCFTLRNMNILERRKLLAKSKSLSIWWKEHQKHDRERLQRERNKKEHEKTKAGALKKLTPKERKALGLR